MSLLAPWLLFGAILGSVPLILHLLNKSKFKVENWGAMMFLQSAAKAKAQRIKVQQWLLLLLRILFFILLALALSRPIIQRSEMGASDQPTSHVVVLDASYSMQRNNKEGSLFDQAKSRLLEIVDSMKRGDNMSVIWAGQRPKEIFGELTYDRELLRSKINNLKAGEESSNLTRAIEQAFFSLEKSTLPIHRVYVIADEQKNNWNTNKTSFWQHLKDHYQLKKVKPGLAFLEVFHEDPIENFRVIDLKPASPIVDLHRITQFWADVDYEGGEEVKTTINFYVDGELKNQKDLTLKEGRQRIIFEHRFVDAGQHVIKTTLGDDNLKIDNSYSRALTVRDQLPILLIDAKGPKGGLQQGGHLLKLALTSAVDLGEKSLLDVTHMSYVDLDNLNLEKLKKFRSLILVNVPSLSQYAKFMLEQYLANGGGLMITMGNLARKDDYNKLFRGEKGLLPAKLIQEAKPKNENLQPQVMSSDKHPILELFSNEEGRVLNGVKVNKFIKLEPAKDAVPLLSLGNDPFVIYQSFRKGRVLLWSSDISGRWGNFPFTKDFLPLVQNLVLYLSASVSPPIHLSQGEPLIVNYDNPEAEANKKVQLITPDEQTHDLPLTFERGNWVAHYDHTEQAGIYKVTHEQDTKYFTVHLPHSEGDLQKLNQDTKKFVNSYLPFEYLALSQDFMRHLAEGMEHLEIWKWILVLAILLLMLEGYLSSRFSR